MKGGGNLDEWGDVFRGKVGLNCWESVMKCKRTGESNGMTLEHSRFSFFFLEGGGVKMCKRDKGYRAGAKARSIKKALTIARWRPSATLHCAVARSQSSITALGQLLVLHQLISSGLLVHFHCISVHQKEMFIDVLKTAIKHNSRNGSPSQTGVLLWLGSPL